MFSELLHEQGLRSSHLPHNRSVGRENGPYFSEENDVVLNIAGQMADITFVLPCV